MTPDTNLQLDLSVDSLEWLNLSLEIRRRAGVELDEEAIGRIETVRELLEEATDASTRGEKLDDATPLTDPESVLTDKQLRHLQPHGWLNSVLARGMFAANRILMRRLFRLEVRGIENLPETPVVITPNHASYLDPLAIAAALPAKRLSTTFWAGWTGQLFTNPITRWFSRLAHVLPIDPQRGVVSSLAFGAAAIECGRNLVWFPEGERSRDGRLKPFRAGIGLLLEHHETTVIPTVIDGAYEAFPSHKRLPRPRKIRVTFGKPLDSNELKQDRDKQEMHEQISRALHEAVESLDSRKLEQKAKNSANSY